VKRTEIEVESVPLGSARMREFVAFHWRHYRAAPYWVPQLNGDLLGNRLLGMTGLLTPEHPFHRDAETVHLLATRAGATVGRVSVARQRRYDAYYGVSVAFLGFFEAGDEATAQALFAAAATWAREHGAHVLRGPGEYTNVTHDRQGCLVKGFDRPVYVEQTWNPPAYAGYFERFGFATAMDYHAYEIDFSVPLPPKMAYVAERVRRRRELRTRPLDMRRFEDDVALVVAIYNQAWAENWGYLPIEAWEVEALVKTLRPLIDPELVRFAYQGDTPIAVIGAFPDPNVLLRPRWRWPGDGDLVRLARLLLGRRRIDRFRLMFFGIVPGHRGQGADALLYEEVYQHTLRRGYQRCDVSLLLDVNTAILRATEALGGVRTKTWRVYDLAL